jgi:hypothetical protein
MPRQRTVLQAFVASPGDTRDERSRLDSVVAEINRGAGSNGPFYLELVKWETHARPAAGRPQQVVFDTTRSDPDILIGIFRQRLGTPTGVAASGTVEEIEAALSFWRRYQEGRGRRIEVMLYFKRPPFDITSDDDHEQLGLVMRFRERMRQEGLDWEFDDPDDFEGAVRGHLTRLLQGWDENAGRTSYADQPPSRGHWAVQLDRTLKDIQCHEHAETATRDPVSDAVQYIRMVANAHDQGLDYSDLINYCDALMRHVPTSRRVEVLIVRGDIERLAGLWQAAYHSLVEASDLAQEHGTPADEAEVVRHLGRITWEHGMLSRDLSERCERLLRQLPKNLIEERAVVGVILADRLAYVPGTLRRRHELATDATGHAEELPNPAIGADILLGARQALYDDEPTSVLFEYAVRVERIGRELKDVHLTSEGLGAQIVDLLRQRNMVAMRAALKRHRQLCSLTVGRPQLFRQLAIEALLSLAEGQFERAAERTSGATHVLSAILAPGDNAAGSDVVLAQEGWCLYERGDEELRPFIVRLVQRLGEGVPSSEDLWRLAVALSYIDMGNVDSGASIFHDVVVAAEGFKGLERGLFRIGTLALGAEIVWRLALECGIDAELRQIARTILVSLSEHGDEGVLVGFPAVFLGDKRRFLGLAEVCAGSVEAGRRHLELAAQFHANAGLGALEARCQWDLAQVMILAGDERARALACARRATERAHELGMRRLAERQLRESKL